eukprot:1015144-Heterocapsa_arctica.AAC.1
MATTKVFHSWMHKIDPNVLRPDNERGRRPAGSWQRAGQQSLHRSAAATMALLLTSENNLEDIKLAWAGVHCFKSGLKPFPYKRKLSRNCLGQVAELGPRHFISEIG